MRLVQIAIPTGKRESVLATLDDEEIDYVVTDEDSRRDYTAVAYVPLPDNAVETVLEDLRDVGVDEDAVTVVLEARTVVSRKYEKLEERYADDEEVDEDRIAREELAARAEEFAPPLSNYAAMTLISAVIATAGLLLDSAAVVVGSMVIAPLVGPAMSAAVGTVLNDNELFARGMKLQIGGLLLTVAGAAVFGGLARELHLIAPFTDVTQIGQINERLAPDFLSLAIALGAGAAGVFSLSTGASTALVGVMIAVALVPPAATVGIGIAWALPGVAIGAGVLALVNWLSINLSAQAVLWYQGYRPSQWFRLPETRDRAIKRIAVLVAAIAVLSVFLGGVTYDSVQRATTEEEIRASVTEVIEREGATLLELEIHRSDDVVLRETEDVVLTVGVPEDRSVTGLAPEIDARIEGAVGHPVETQVRYVTTGSA